MTNSPLIEDHAAGAGIAALEMHRVTLSLLILHGVVPKNLTISMLDEALHMLERLQMKSSPETVAQVKAARFLLDLQIKQLSKISPPGQ